MNVSKFIRSPLLIILAVASLLYALVFMAPLTWFRIKTRYWESQIRQDQNPAELQAWATKLLVTYGQSNLAERDCVPVTNKPPPGFPGAISCDVALMNDKNWGGGCYVQLLWAANPFVGRWGMRISDTNFVCGLPDKWKPGIYFFSGP
jgi:hypothetical protein